MKPSLRSVFAVLLMSSIVGCAQQQVADSAALDRKALAALEGSAWKVIRINEDSVSPAVPTISFAAEGRMSGTSGCNRYFGQWSVAESALKLKPAGSTMMACPDEFMAKEGALLGALDSIFLVTQSEAGNLLLTSVETDIRLELAPLEAEPEVREPEPMDLASKLSYSFDCNDIGPVSMRFVGPDTVELMVSGDTLTLQSIRSASGARYSGGDTEFWTKGDSATLSQGDRRFQCAVVPR